MRPERPLQVELVDLDRGEGLHGDQGLYVPVQVAPIGKAHLQSVQAVLPLLDPRLPAEAVFEKQEPAAAFLHPVHFPQRLSDILDAAQSKRADDTIESAVLEGQPFATENLLVNF